MRKEITHNWNLLNIASICYPARVRMHVLDHIVTIYIDRFVIDQCLTHQRHKSSVQVEIKFNPNFEAKKRLYMYSVVFH